MIEETKKPMYVYIKGDKYKTYKVYREEDKELKEISKEFNNFEELILWVYQFSNLNDVPVQFYQ